MDIAQITRDLPAICCGIFVSILFIQSGLDKLFDWGGNLSFLKDHFAKTFVAGMVPMMLATITLLELLTGMLAGAGVIALLLTASPTILFYSSIAGAASITALFFGQRIAKDYPGAAVLVPYFLLIIVLMALTNR